MKKCCKCLMLKSKTEFSKESRTSDGLRTRCKKCLNEYYKTIYPKIRYRKLKSANEYYLKNKSKIKEASKNHNRRPIKERKKVNDLWRSKNKEKINKRAREYEKNRIKVDANYRLIKNMRKLIYRIFTYKSKRTFDVLGYNVNDLLKQLGRYPNQNESIDHKVPVSWFIENTDIKIINNLENLHILTKSDNYKKGNSFSHPIPKEYYNTIKQFIKPNYINKLKTI